uniref:B-cell receptor CD22 n=1 Tax=Leptobrachium leishanense TaxID=445787 RepID=A0A8C5WHR1_9ANUR
MDTLLHQFTMVGGLLVLFGLVNSHYPSIIFPKEIATWNDSCIKIPCEVKSYQSQYTYVWFQNPEYNKLLGEFEGRVAYNSSIGGTVDTSFKNRVESLDLQRCSILIKNLQHEDAGLYQVRLWPKDENNKKEKWLSPQHLNLTVADYGPSFKIDPAALRTREGQQVTLICSLNYNCPDNGLQLSWTGNMKNKQESSNTVDLEKTNTLSFTASWEDHNETFRCLLSRNSMEQETRSMVLNVEYAPKGVQISPNNSTFTIVKGEELTLQCLVKSSNPSIGTFTWYETSNWKVKEVQKQNQNYTVTKSGKYQCEAENNIGKVMSTEVTVQVQYAPESVKISIESGEITEGKSVRLKCTASASPPVSSYRWYKNGVTVDGQTHQLYYRTLTEYDSGSYECEAQNHLGSKRSSPLELNVKYGPKYPEILLDPEGNTFIEGKEVTVHCTVNRSNPSVSNIKWYQNDKLLSSSSSWSLSLKLTPEQSGNYKCQAENEVGSAVSNVVSIKVRYPPKEVRVEVVGRAPVEEGQELTVKCTASESEPRVKDHQWYKNEKLFKTDSNIITFKNIKWTDSGDYSCEAKHDIGNVKSQVMKINVLYAPRNISISIVPSESVTEYSLVKMTCNMKSNPKPEYFSWYKNNAELEVYDQTLSLANIKLDGEGKYQCSVTNNVGKGQSDTVYIRVLYSTYSIIKYVAGGVGLFLLLLVIIILSIRFKIWTKFKRPATDDVSDSSFFVLKKSHSDSPEGAERQCPSVCMAGDLMDYASIQPASPDEGNYQVPRKLVKCQEAGDIYSTVKKPRHASVPNEYENVQSSVNPDESKEELHYSTITNLAKKDTVRHVVLGVEYAMLRH